MNCESKQFLAYTSISMVRCPAVSAEGVQAHRVAKGTVNKSIIEQNCHLIKGTSSALALRTAPGFYEEKIAFKKRQYLTLINNYRQKSSLPFTLLKINNNAIHTLSLRPLHCGIRMHQQQQSMILTTSFTCLYSRHNARFPRTLMPHPIFLR